MGPRNKLNSAHIKVALLVAAIAGMTLGSWVAAIVVLGLCMAFSVNNRDIR